MNVARLKKTLLLMLIFNSLNILGDITTNIHKDEILFPNQPQSADFYTLNIGAWIIVAGDRESDHDLYYCLEQGCIDVYNKLINLGYSHDDIYFLAGNWDGSLPPNADDVSTRINIEYAVINWASLKVNENKGLGIYLLSHGGYNKMALPGADLSDTQLDSYLSSLEWISDMERSVVIYDACHSGSFIDPLSKEGRIIITSTNIDNRAFENSDDSHGLFSENFWTALSNGDLLGNCFVYATDCVDLLGINSEQTPLIDDNCDEIGHEVNSYFHSLPNGGDGWDALQITLGKTNLHPEFVVLDKCSLRTYIPEGMEELHLWTILDNNTEIEFVKARIFPEWWEWPAPHVDDDGIAYFTESDFLSLESFDLTLKPEPGINGGKNYSTSIYIPKNPSIFGQGNGTYKIIYEAKSKSGQVAKPLVSSVVINENGEAPLDLIPPTVKILNPLADLAIQGLLNITVEGEDDQALDQIQIVLDGKILETFEMPSYLPYPVETHSVDTFKMKDGIHNLTAIAYDLAGNRQQSSVFINFQNGSILNFDYMPYLIGAAVGIGIFMFGTLLIRTKKKK
ncbi:C13 family peptidase [Candidatus Lokiarchaeum ossiferum]|uniref:C13 family peptidase n=1 Tax=Candidatus Lokiarchaeum ossiferum TaxID=2951803 RepID=UPI00352DDD2B